MLKLAITTAAVAGTFAVAAWGLGSFLTIDDLKDCSQPDPMVARCAPADVIIAISGGDTRSRTDEAIRLYKQGWAPQLIFSGAAQDTSGPSNAEAMRTQAIKADVPITDIFLDTRAVDTLQNAIGSNRLLTPTDKRVILVTSPYHQRRASIEFQKAVGDQVKIVNHPTPTDSAWGPYWWLTPYGWWLALSEFLKSMVAYIWH